MNLYACGLNYKIADVNLRECFAYSLSEQEILLNEILAAGLATEIVILSTCHRTELYFVSNNAEILVDWLANKQQIDVGLLKTSWITYVGSQAIQHIMRVCCGLESLALGESQIFGQVKIAYAQACKANTVGAYFKKIFPNIFASVKQILTSTKINSSAISISSLVARLIKETLSNVTHNKILLMGTGEAIELVIKSLSSHGLLNCTIAGRNIEKADRLAKKFGSTAISLGMVEQHLDKIGAIVTAMSGGEIFIHKKMLEKINYNRPILIIDIAMPRNVHPEVKTFPNVVLYNIDDLSAVAQRNKDKRLNAAIMANKLIEQSAILIEKNLSSLQAGHIINAFRASIKNLQTQAVDQGLRDLAKGLAPEIVLKATMTSLTNKILHKPTLTLRHAASNRRYDFLAFMQEFLD